MAEFKFEIVAKAYTTHHIDETEQRFLRAIHDFRRRHVDFATLLYTYRMNVRATLITRIDVDHFFGLERRTIGLVNNLAQRLYHVVGTYKRLLLMPEHGKQRRVDEP